MQTCHLIALMIMQLIIVAIIFYSTMAAPIPHANYFKQIAVAADPPSTPKEICQKTVLYIYTYPEQKEKTILCHPDAKAEKHQNEMNILWNKGLLAAQHSSLIKCPSSDKSFCDGWQYQKAYLK